MTLFILNSQPRTLIKIERFCDLPVGWDYGRGGPISSDTIRNAKKIYHNISVVGFHRTDAFAGAAGEVLVTAYYGKNYIAITIEADGLCSVLHERDRIECCSYDNVQIEEVKTAIRGIAREIWGSSDSSIVTTSTPILGN